MKTVSRMAQVVRDITRAAGDAEKAAAEELLTIANRRVPHDTGMLQASGRVIQDDTTTAVLYHAPYAHRQHEDVTLRHKTGREARWLARAAQRNSDHLQRVAAHVMRARI